MNFEPLLTFLRVCLPDYWVMNNKYDEAWDKKLNALMRSYRFEKDSHYYAKIGNVTIWIANHPYASFTSAPGGMRPSRMTICRAKRKQKRDFFYQEQQQISNFIKNRQPVLPTPQEYEGMVMELKELKEKVKNYEEILDIK